jgi:tetratricopeptide (TPR) repeat protein
LSAYASDEHVPLREFSQRAAAWRALATKPALPETTRVRRLMAEDALKNQKPEEALKYYEQGLESYPMWPQGWFNAALVAGELGDYDDAADYMQNYLELVPGTPDAQTARDQMEMWKVKATEKK